MMVKSHSHPDPPVRKAPRALEDPPAVSYLVTAIASSRKEPEICGPDSFLRAGVPGPQIVLVPLPFVLQTNATVQKVTGEDCTGSYANLAFIVKKHGYSILFDESFVSVFQFSDVLQKPISTYKAYLKYS